MIHLDEYGQTGNCAPPILAELADEWEATGTTWQSDTPG